MTTSAVCLCCAAGIPKNGPRVCPECKHVFRGLAWEGIDAHWKARHSDVLPYEEFWGAVCREHGGP
jgi:hypothetical protein